MGLLDFFAGGGIRKMVRAEFTQYLANREHIKIMPDGKCKMLNYIFENKEIAKTFALNVQLDSRFSGRINPNVNKRLSIHKETMSKKDILYVKDGKSSSFNALDYDSLGRLIEDIWYIESGVRAEYNFTKESEEMNKKILEAMDPEHRRYMPKYDNATSRIITDEFEKQCQIHKLDNE